MVFSRLPSLMAADKPHPLLQPSLNQPPYSCFRPTNTTVATEATMVASKPNVVATAAIRNHKVNGGPGMYFSILAKIKNIMTNIANFGSKS